MNFPVAPVADLTIYIPCGMPEMSILELSTVPICMTTAPVAEKIVAPPDIPSICKWVVAGFGYIFNASVASGVLSM